MESPSRMISRMLATAEVRNSPTKGQKAVIIYNETAATPSDLAREGVCPRTTFYRSLHNQQQGFNIGKKGNRQKLSDEDELLLVAYVLNARMNGYVVGPEDVNNMVSVFFL